MTFQYFPIQRMAGRLPASRLSTRWSSQGSITAPMRSFSGVNSLGEFAFCQRMKSQGNHWPSAMRIGNKPTQQLLQHCVVNPLRAEISLNINDNIRFTWVWKIRLWIASPLVVASIHDSKFKLPVLFRFRILNSNFHSSSVWYVPGSPRATTHTPWWKTM